MMGGPGTNSAAWLRPEDEIAALREDRDHWAEVAHTRNVELHRLRNEVDAAMDIAESDAMHRAYCDDLVADLDAARAALQRVAKLAEPVIAAASRSLVEHRTTEVKISDECIFEDCDAPNHPNCPQWAAHHVKAECGLCLQISDLRRALSVEAAEGNTE